MFSRAVSDGIRLYCWKMKPSRSRRSSVSWFLFSFEMSVSPMYAEPPGQPVEARDALHQRALPGAGRPHDRGELVLGEVDGHTGERVDGCLALAVRLAGLDGACGRRAGGRLGGGGHRLPRLVVITSVTRTSIESGRSPGALPDPGEIDHEVRQTAERAVDRSHSEGTSYALQGAGVTGLVLVLNAGSSSLKYQVVDPSSGRASVHGSVERIGEGAAPDHDAALATMSADLERHRVTAAELIAVGHRVVHGGPSLVDPTVVDDDVLGEIDDLARLAPLHNPPAAAGIRSARQHYPDLPQIAVFDTAFFADLPAAAATYALPSEVTATGIRRYGAHGISHQYVASAAAAFLGRPVGDLDQIVLHLGNGASASAISGGRPVDTSMGLTPLEGLVMGTRAGDLDPGAARAPAASRRPRPGRARGPAAPRLRPARDGGQDRLPGHPGRDGRRRPTGADGVRRLRPPAPQVPRRLPRGAVRSGRHHVHSGRGRAQPPGARERAAGSRDLRSRPRRGPQHGRRRGAPHLDRRAPRPPCWWSRRTRSWRSRGRSSRSSTLAEPWLRSRRWWSRRR